jgi:hypothetical protein
MLRHRVTVQLVVHVVADIDVGQLVDLEAGGLCGRRVLRDPEERASEPHADPVARVGRPIERAIRVRPAVGSTTSAAAYDEWFGLMFKRRELEENAP